MYEWIHICGDTYLLRERCLDKLEYIQYPKRHALGHDGHVAVSAVLQLVQRLEHGRGGLHAIRLAGHDGVDGGGGVDVLRKE